MTSTPIYLLDSDVFIAAKNTYYSFDICPGFWKALMHQHGIGSVYSISRVRNELLVGSKTEDLHQWVSNEVPAEFFLDVDIEKVMDIYKCIMLWS